ncbi:TPA: hypothetical protein N0F65_011512 [Lagenidium giganteum]|uniref:Secreted protein n=1 Tax=Lagenidium giganteum TaxID=4803 RepID=A0AAV2Z2F9_9STRA|nr:TPA: hypothetical protein N0F65_011512 [Lagenidium giganteum]
MCSGTVPLLSKCGYTSSVIGWGGVCCCPSSTPCARDVPSVGALRSPWKSRFASALPTLLYCGSHASLAKNLVAFDFHRVACTLGSTLRHGASS